MSKTHTHTHTHIRALPGETQAAPASWFVKVFLSWTDWCYMTAGRGRNRTWGTWVPPLYEFSETPDLHRCQTLSSWTNAFLHLIVLCSVCRFTGRNKASFPLAVSMHELWNFIMSVVISSEALISVQILIRLLGIGIPTRRSTLIILKMYACHLYRLSMHVCDNFLEFAFVLQWNVPCCWNNKTVVKNQSNSKMRNDFTE